MRSLIPTVLIGALAFLAAPARLQAQCDIYAESYLEYEDYGGLAYLWGYAATYGWGYECEYDFGVVAWMEGSSGLPSGSSFPSNGEDAVVYLSAVATQRNQWYYLVADHYYSDYYYGTYLFYQSWVSVYVPPPPPVINSVTTDAQPWYSGSSYSIDIYGSGFTAQPWIWGCSAIDQASWTVTSTHISGSLFVSPDLDIECTVMIMLGAALVTSVAAAPAPVVPDSMVVVQDYTNSDYYGYAVRAVTYQVKLSNSSNAGYIAICETDPSPPRTWTCTGQQPTLSLTSCSGPPATQGPTVDFRTSGRSTPRATRVAVSKAARSHGFGLLLAATTNSAL